MSESFQWPKFSQGGEREERKPRDKGLTMVADWGLTTGEAQGLVDMAGCHFDLAKLAGCSSLVMNEASLRHKLDIYRSGGVRSFPGGVLFEHFRRNSAVDEYFAAASEFGYESVEISDDGSRIPLEERTAAIARATNHHGLTVLAEVGSKAPESYEGEELGKDAAVCLEAGAWKVLIEAAVLFERGVPRVDLVEDIVSAVGGADNLIFEVPGQWVAEVPRVGGYEVVQMIKELLRIIGPSVNLGNIEREVLLYVETLRRDFVENPLGISVDV